MPFTLWSNGLLIGETDFALGGRSGGKRAGVFHPTPFGMTLVPTLTAMAPALFELHAMFTREGLTADDIERDGADAALDVFATTPEGQRVMSIAKHLADLELRDPSGELMDTESIAVNDVEQLAMMAGDDVRPGTEAADARVRGGDPVRYLISATLRRDASAGASGGRRRVDDSAGLH